MLAAEDRRHRGAGSGFLLEIEVIAVKDVKQVGWVAEIAGLACLQMRWPPV
jgi:hypothetical protein